MSLIGQKQAKLSNAEVANAVHKIGDVLKSLGFDDVQKVVVLQECLSVAFDGLLMMNKVEAKSPNEKAEAFLEVLAKALGGDDDGRD